MERNLAAVFILTADGKSIADFYSLSAHWIHAADLPQELIGKLPRFPIPVTLLGWMGVSQPRRQNRHLPAARLQCWLGSAILPQTRNRLLAASPLLTR
jgi:hypothetical protein